MRFRRFKAITYFLLNKHATMSVRPLNMLSMILIFNQRLCSFSYPLFIPVSRPVHYAALENFISNFVIVVGASNANQRLCTSYSLSTKRLGQVRVKIEGLSGFLNIHWSISYFCLYRIQDAVVTLRDRGTFKLWRPVSNVTPPSY